MLWFWRREGRQAEARAVLQVELGAESELGKSLVNLAAYETQPITVAEPS